MLIYNGVAFPEKYRDLLIYPNVFRKSVRGYRVDPKGGSYALREEITLMTADDDLFRPCQAVVGPDGAIYVVDWRSNSGAPAGSGAIRNMVGSTSSPGKATAKIPPCRSRKTTGTA